MTVGPQLKKIYWSLVLVFFLFSMAVTVAGYLFFEDQKKSLKQEKWDQLGAIADLKVSQIINWRKERIQDGLIIFESPFIAPRLQHWFKDPKAGGVDKEVLGWMTSLQGSRYIGELFKHLLINGDQWDIRGNILHSSGRHRPSA